MTPRRSNFKRQFPPAKPPQWLDWSPFRWQYGPRQTHIVPESGFARRDFNAFCAMADRFSRESREKLGSAGLFLKGSA